MYSWLMYTNQKKQKEPHNEKGKSWTQTEGRLLTKQVLQTGGTHDDGTTKESHGQLATVLPMCPGKPDFQEWSKGRCCLPKTGLRVKLC